MIFSIAMRFLDGKTRRALGGGRFAPRVSWTKCAFRYALHPRPGQPRVRPTRRPLSPSPQRHRKSRFAGASFAASSVAQSIVRSIRALAMPRRWSEGAVGGCGRAKQKQISVYSGGACCRQGQTLVCTPDDTHHAACIASRKINRHVSPRP